MSINIQHIRESGLLELYVLGDLGNVDVQTIEQALIDFPDLKKDIDSIEIALEKFAFANAKEPDPTLGPFLVTTLDYMERIKAGEEPTFPPALHEGSTIDDFKEWLDRDDMVEPEEYEAMHGKIIGSTEGRTTIITWLKYGAPDETHTDEYEKFLVVEGTCDITIGDKVHSLKAGDYLAIPLHINHRVEVTSSFRCKVILERAAA